MIHDFNEFKELYPKLAKAYETSAPYAIDDSYSFIKATAQDPRFFSHWKIACDTNPYPDNCPYVFGKTFEFGPLLARPK